MYWLLARDLQAGQRHDERLEPEAGRDAALDRAEGRAAGDDEQDRRDQPQPAGMVVR